VIGKGSHAACLPAAFVTGLTGRESLARRDSKDQRLLFPQRLAEHIAQERHCRRHLVSPQIVNLVEHIEEMGHMRLERLQKINLGGGNRRVGGEDDNRCVALR
jgi:hypothetical protein